MMELDSLWHVIKLYSITMSAADISLSRGTLSAGTQHWNNIDSTLIQRQDVESMLNRRCFNVVCPLGSFTNLLTRARIRDIQAAKFILRDVTREAGITIRTLRNATFVFISTHKWRQNISTSQRPRLNYGRYTDNTCLVLLYTNNYIRPYRRWGVCAYVRGWGAWQAGL